MMNFTANKNRTLKYVNSVLDDHQLCILTITVCTVALLGIILNTVIVLITKGESTYRGPVEDKRRKSLMYYFIYNLALSDLLSSLISSPSLALFQYIHFFHTDVGCGVFRYIQYVFPSVSNQILSVMCIERYCTLVYPFDNTRKNWPYRLVKMVWISGLSFAGVMSYSFRAKREYLDHSIYTMDCVQEMRNSAKKAMYLLGLFFTFILPLFIILSTTLRSLCVIIRYRRSTRPMTRAAAVKVQATWLAIWLVIIYAITSFPFAIYQAFKFTKGRELKLARTTDSLLRYSFGILVLFNGVINPAMYCTNIRSLRRRCKSILKLSHNSQNAVDVTPTDNATFHNESKSVANVTIRLSKAPIEDYQGHSSKPWASQP